MRNFFRVVLLAVLAGFAVPAAALADHPGQPPLDPAILKDLYRPIGFYKPGDPVPAPNGYYGSVEKAGMVNGRRFNPSGNYNAFDSNVFETLALPFRAAGDKTTDDPFGNAPKGRSEDPRHGFCSQPHDPIARPGNSALVPGVCPNHQLEYGMYYEETMRDILGDFGMTFRRYRFQNPGSDNTLAGSAINPAAVVPGADHPEETVIIGAHYDQTNDGPASTWDSAEGHAQIIRVAKIMADYWRQTGTRPSATVKFIPWDGEESGTLGSLDYATNNIVPGEDHKVRSYFNTDPCAGGYPAFRSNTVPAERIDLGIQLADPAELDSGVDGDRIKAFNEKAPKDLEAAFEYLDDKLNSVTGAPEIFVSKGEGGARSDIGRDVILSGNRPFLFSSDWRNFEVKGIPFFNPGPEITGPDQTLEEPATRTASRSSTRRTTTSRPSTG